MLLTDKVAVVSGIGPGLSRSIANALAAQGAAVTVTGLLDDLGRDVAEEVGGTYIRTDVTSMEQCTAAADAVAEDRGRLDILVNVAYLYDRRAPAMEADLDHWREIFDVNLFGTLQMTKAVVPHMRAQRDGRIVMINTTGTILVRPFTGAYSASKAALHTACQTIARELGPDGIRVNAIHPSFIWADALKRDFATRAEQLGTTTEALYDAAADETALGYLPGPEEIADTVVFLASDLARSLTGQRFSPSAGRCMA